MINNKEDNFDDLTIYFCDTNNVCKMVIKCKTLCRVSRIRYLGLTVDKHLRWNLHLDNLVMSLRILSFSFYKLRKVVSMQVIRTVHFGLHQAILQYGLLI